MPDGVEQNKNGLNGQTKHTKKNEGAIWNQKMVLQSDAIEEPFLVPQKNLSNQGSLKNHFHKEFFKGPSEMVL